MARLNLRLLGDFEARLGSGPSLPLRARKTQALLAYLASSPGQSHSRDKLASLLWGDSSQSQARSRLRGSLFVLRRALASDDPPCLALDGDAVALDVDTVDVDVVAFRRLAGVHDPEALAKGVELYRGDLLEGFAFRGELFEEWLIGERERLRELAIDALAKLLVHQRSSGVFEAAVQTGLRLVALDPLQESVHRTLMRLYAELGRRPAALRQYQMCVRVLRREIGVEPDAETKRLYRELVTWQPQNSAKASNRARPHDRHDAEQPSLDALGKDAPLIGRESERAQLREVLQGIAEGHGRVVTVVGEAGIGKTSVLDGLAGDASALGAQVLVGRCYESTSILPFGPWVDAFRSGPILGDEILQELHPVWRSEIARLLPEANTAGLPAPSDDPLRLFEGVAHFVETLATRRPLVLMLEDIHWADEMSLRLFAFVARRTQKAPVVIAATVREEELSSAVVLKRVLDEAATGPYFVRIPLSPLSRGDTATLVRLLARRGSEETLVAHLIERLWAASKGNPFLIVETMRALDEGTVTNTTSTLPLPERLREVIAGRLERLSQRGQELAAVAAVIGREFEFPVLQTAAGLHVRDAAEGVEELVRRRVLHGIGERFDFTHERVREVVRDRLFAVHRKLLHCQVAKAIEKIYAENLEPHYAALGAHCREGEVWEQAATYLRQAGIQAVARSAYSEAASLFTQAVAAIARLPATGKTTELIIDIHLDLRNALIPLGEYARLGKHLHEAEMLARTLGDQQRLARIATFMVVQCLFTGDYSDSVRFGKEALSIARTLGDRSIEVVATSFLGRTYVTRGQFSDAATLLERNVALEGVLRYERFGTPAIQSAVSAAWLAEAFSQLGRFDEAIAHAETAVHIAEAANHPYTLYFGLLWLGLAHLRRGDLPRATRVLERCHDLCRTLQIVIPVVGASLGAAYALAGRADEALPLIAGALEEFRGLPVHFHPGLILLCAGCTYLCAGRIDEAAGRGREALALTRRLGARASEAHALCLAADIASAAGADDAERFYREALTLAHELAMRPLIAHCHLGLGKLYPRIGKHEQAHEHLATATTMYREMAMTYWLEQAEA